MTNQVKRQKATYPHPAILAILGLPIAASVIFPSFAKEVDKALEAIFEPMAENVKAERQAPKPALSREGSIRRGAIVSKSVQDLQSFYRFDGGTHEVWNAGDKRPVTHVQCTDDTCQFKSFRYLNSDTTLYSQASSIRTQ